MMLHSARCNRCISSGGGDCATCKPESDIPMRDIPSSKELIQLATNDFKNREERKGLYDQSSWVSGWVTGFLSERKPNWSKVLEEKVRKDTLESFSGFIDAYRREDEDGHDYVSVLALQKHIDWLMETE